jgi:membrane protease YdiL (CAAX protease family)
VSPEQSASDGVATITDPVLKSGLAAAYVGFALTFRGPRRRFWQRMTWTGLGLGSLALAAEPELRRTRPRGKDVALGLASAAALYGIFRVGDRLARRLMPAGGSEIEAIYDLRSLRSRTELTARLALIIGPTEELFWRGLVQKRMSDALGPLRGALLASAAYGGAHAVTGNLTLLGAATVAGTFWGLLSAAGASPAALIVSHAAWDITIFLIAPTESPSD